MKSDEERKMWFLWIKKTTLRIFDGIDNPIYLIRYSLFTCPWFAIKLHRILMSDDNCMHDHPWSFISIILWGGYVEESPDYSVMHKSVGFPYTLKRLYGPGSILWRPTPSVHRLVIFQPATTLVITFKKKRNWGFYTSKGWVLWSTFIRKGLRCD